MMPTMSRLTRALTCFALITLASTSFSSEPNMYYTTTKNAMTKEIFESAFTQPNALGITWELFKADPTQAEVFLFAGEKDKVTGELKQQQVPLCSVSLARRDDARGGIALVNNEKCLEMIKLIQQTVGGKALDALQIVYRCYPNNADTFDPLNYKLHQAKINRIGRDRGFWVFYFTRQPEDGSCSPRWLDEVGIDDQMRYIKEKVGAEQFAESLRLDGAEELTKAVYEKAFGQTALRAQFEMNPRLSWVFYRKIASDTLAPVDHCLVTMLDETKGAIKSNCSGVLDVIQKMDDNKHLHAILPYRCYLHSNQSDWELQTATILDFGMDPESPVKQHHIYYRLPETEHCSAKLKVDDADDQEMTAQEAVVHQIIEDEDDEDEEEYFHTEL